MMSDISIYFTEPELNLQEKDHGLGSLLNVHRDGKFPEWETCKIALFGVLESRNVKLNSGCEHAPKEIRKKLYNLYSGDWNLSVCDLGDIKPGKKPQDTYFAVKDVVSTLVKKNVIPIIMGGSNDLCFANYLGYEDLEQTVNLCMVDRSFDIGEADDDISNNSFLNKIILHQPNYLFNYSNLGYQTYYVNPSTLKLISNLFFEATRLGTIREDISIAEPVIRHSDIVGFDISAIKGADAPGFENAGPNGFSGEEACQLSWYAGISDKLSSFGVYEYNPKFDEHKRTAELVAQMIWYFIEGVNNRKNDIPKGKKSQYVKYRVALDGQENEILFYKSKKTDRWWMDVPYPHNKGLKYQRHHMVPCTYQDYQNACNEIMPDRWWKTFQKLI